MKAGGLVVGGWLPLSADLGWAVRVYRLARQLSRLSDVTLLPRGSRGPPERRRLAKKGCWSRPLARSSLARTRRMGSSLLRARYRTSPRRFIRTPSNGRSTNCSREIRTTSSNSGRHSSHISAPATVPIIPEAHKHQLQALRRDGWIKQSPLRKAFYRFKLLDSAIRTQDTWRERRATSLTPPASQHACRHHSAQTRTMVVPTASTSTTCGRAQTDQASIVFDGVLDYRPEPRRCASS